MDTTKLAYLAGIIDGEGSVNITYLEKRREYRMRLYVVNTDIRLINWLSDNFGGLVYHAKRHTVKHPSWKEKYEWVYIPSKDKVGLLEELLPYMVVKPEQLSIAIEYLKTTSKPGIRIGEEAKNIRKSLHAKLRILNSRGVATTK